MESLGASYSFFFFAKLQVITKDDWDRWCVVEGSTFVWVRNVNLKSDPTTVQHRNCKMSWFVDERNPMIGEWNQGACQSWGSRESVKVSGLKINVQHISLNGKNKNKNQASKQQQQKKTIFLAQHCGRAKLDQGAVTWLYNILMCDRLWCWKPFRLTFDPTVLLVGNHRLSTEAHVRLTLQPSDHLQFFALRRMRLDCQKYFLAS